MKIGTNGIFIMILNKWNKQMETELDSCRGIKPKAVLTPRVIGGEIIPYLSAMNFGPKKTKHRKIIKNRKMN